MVQSTTPAGSDIRTLKQKAGVAFKGKDLERVLIMLGLTHQAKIGMMSGNPKALLMMSATASNRFPLSSSKVSISQFDKQCNS